MLNDKIDQEDTIASELATHKLDHTVTPNNNTSDPLGQPIFDNEAAMAMNEVANAMQQVTTHCDNLDNLINQRNEEQLQIFKDIQASVDHGLPYYNAECNCTSFRPTLLYVSGQAEADKSFLIKVVTAYVHRKTCCKLSCAVTALTGLAADNIQGIT